MEKQTTSPTLDKQILDYLRREGQVLSYSRGAHIIRRGEPGEAFHVILSGKAEVRLVGDDGEELRLRRLGKGDFFGEMSVMTGDPVSADVVAMGQVTLLTFPAKLFSTAMAECKPLREKIMARLVSNLRGSSEDLWNLYQRAEALNVILDAHAHKGPIVADSRKMQKLEEEIASLSQQKGPLLVTGGAGTGKVFVAAKIHEAGSDPGSPFIVIDCQTLHESEAREFLFGSSHFLEEQDDPSGIDSLHRYGAIHLANEGTLVLRNVEALASPAQKDLFNYLNRVRTGSLSYPRVRVMATSCKGPAVLHGEHGLYPALAKELLQTVVTMPTLRARRKDILPLARLFLEERPDEKRPRLSTGAEHVLVSRRYGHRNVAELREAVEMAAVFAGGHEILGEYIFTGPKEEGTPLEYDLGQIPFVKRLVSDRVLAGLRWAVFGVFSAIVLMSLVAAGTEIGQIANSLIWGLWWPVLIFAFLFIGRLWCTVCPLATSGRWAFRIKSLGRPPSGWLKKYSGWFIPLGFISIIWFEQTFHMTQNPAASGILLLSLMTAAVLFSVVYQRETWCRYLCPLGNLGAIYSLPATVSVRANPDVCATFCNTHECHKGSEKHDACPVFHHPLYARDGQVCKLCFNCLKSCPHGSVKLYLRPPLIRIWSQADIGGTLSFFAVIVFFIAPIMLASHKVIWISGTTGFTVSTAVAVALAIVLRFFLPRLLCTDPDPEPAVVARVAFALLVLAWGPVAAFHLANSSALTGLNLSAGTGSFWEHLFPQGQIQLVLLLQLGAVMISGGFAGISLWGIRSRFVREGVPLSRMGWRTLVSLCLLYLVTSVGLVLRETVKM